MMQRLTVLIVVLIGALDAYRTGAQLYPEDTATPLIDRMRVERFTESLSEDHRIVVLALFDDYAEDVGSTWQEYLEADAAISAEIRKYREDHPDEPRLSIRYSKDFGFHRLLQARRRYAESRLTAIVETVRAVVFDDTAAASRWDATVQEDWRERMFRMVDPSGQALSVTNLLDVVNSFDLSDDEHTALGPVIQSYGEELDRIFQPFVAGYIALDDRLHKIRMRLARGDPEALQRSTEAAKWYRGFNEAIAALNGQFGSQFAAALSGVNRQGWSVAMEAASYQPLFRKSPVDALVEALREDEGIGTDLKMTIEIVYDEYITSRDGLRVHATETLRRWAQSGGYEAADADYKVRREAAQNGDRNANPWDAYANNPVIPFLHRLVKTEQQATRTLRAVLGPELIKRLRPHVRWLLKWDEE